MSIQERYKQLIDFYANSNKSAFAKKINVSPSVIENITGSRGTNPSFEVIAKTLSAFENVNARWLILGEGEMEVNCNKNEYSAPQVPGTSLVEEVSHGYMTTKEALEMIRDLAGENAVLKHKLESGEQSKRVKPKVHGDNATER